MSFAFAAATGQEGRLIGFILDAPTYLLDYGHAFVPYPHPGPTTANNAGAGTWEAHKIANTNWRVESTDINAFMVFIFKSLDRIALAWFFQPLRRRYNMDPVNVMTVMNREYGVAEAEVVSRWITNLQEPMLPTASV
jgi:hypothetical protein